MKSKKVVICGAGIVGKHELVDRIAEANGAKPRWVRHKSDVTVHCDIKTSDCTLELVSFTGAIVYFDDLVPVVLSNADVIVFVISSVSRYRENQITFLEQYRNAASPLRKTWDEIPWLIVANQIDHGDPHEALKDFRSVKSRATFCTNAKTGEGVPEFWEGLQRTIRTIA